MAQNQKFQGVKTNVSRGPESHITGRDVWGFYHNTCVAQLDNNNNVKLHSGGWRTATTKTRMNQFSNEFCGGRFRVYQKNNTWFVSYAGAELDYFDGMVLEA